MMIQIKPSEAERAYGCAKSLCPGERDCNGNGQWEKVGPNSSAAFGEECHKLADHCLRHHCEIHEAVGKVPFEITEAHIDAISGYVDELQRIGPFDSEFAIRLEALTDGLFTDGRADSIWLDPTNSTLHLYDLKTGAAPHSPASAQLVLYAWGYAEQYGRPEQVVLGIFQNGIWSRRRMSWAELEARALIAQEGIRKRHGRDGANVEPQLCTYCPRRRGR